MKKINQFPKTNLYMKCTSFDAYIIMYMFTEKKNNFYLYFYVRC